MGYIDPTKETFARFKDLPRDRPVQMLNLVRLREWAAYPDGRRVSGRDAYRAYARATGPLFQRLGGRQVWIATPELLLIGPDDERWDLAFIAEYPTGQAFIDMLRDPVYREAVQHRQAAVQDSRLLRTRPARAGATFGEALDDEAG